MTIYFIPSLLRCAKARMSMQRWLVRHQLLNTRIGHLRVTVVASLSVAITCRTYRPECSPPEISTLDVPLMVSVASFAWVRGAGAVCAANARVTPSLRTSDQSNVMSKSSLGSFRAMNPELTPITILSPPDPEELGCQLGGCQPSGCQPSGFHATDQYVGQVIVATRLPLATVPTMRVSVPLDSS